MPKKTPIHIEQKIIFEYEKETSLETIAKDFNCSKSLIWGILTRNNIKKNRWNKYDCNHNFFEKIDTEEKAYILGFLTGDGNVGYKSKKNRITIGLQKEDIDILEKIKKALNSNHKITTRTTKSTQTQEEYEEARLVIHSAKMRQDLNDLGLHERKSYTNSYIFPNIPKHLLRHYLRGLIDSDGTICYNEENKNWILSPSGEYKLCKMFSNKILEELNIGQRKIRKDGSIYETPYQAVQDVRIIAKFLYENSNISLNRKSKLAKEILKIKRFRKRRIGYAFNKRKNKFEATITINKKSIYLGAYHTKQEAFVAYRIALLASRTRNIPHSFFKSLAQKASKHTNLWLRLFQKDEEMKKMMIKHGII